MENLRSTPPTLYYILAVVLLVWNAMGLFAFFGQLSMGEEHLATLSEAERSMYENMPFWVIVAFAMAVFGGTLGCVGLLLKRSWAKTMFIVSLIGIVVQMIYNLFIGGTMDVYGPGALIMPIMVLIIGIFLVWFAGYSNRKGWLK